MEKLLKDAYDYGMKDVEKGEVADYIPELAKADKHHAGIVLIDKDGKVYKEGEVEERFTIQSIAKVVTFLLVLEEIDKEKIMKTLDIKPTALPFNSIMDLELSGGKPRNPMVNAGAMAATSLLYEKYGEDMFELSLDKLRKITGNKDLEISEEVYNSEKATAYNNYGIINIMAARGYVNDELPLKDVANMYFRICSANVNGEDLGRMSMVISNDGMDIITKERVFEEKYGRVLRTIMASSGMYNYSGEFAMRVGLPGKSGVGGGIVTASKDGIGLATYCPGLDENGNSLVGIRMLEYISKELDLGIY